jgi:hypothetical protein
MAGLFRIFAATTKSRKMRKALLLFVSAFCGYAIIDLYGPWSSDFRKFDPSAIARLETDMWRAYYDKRPVRLFLLLAETLREHSGMPLLQSNVNAYRAARAAIVFKEGKSRSDYNRALPYLEQYYRALYSIGHFDRSPARMAELELEWWIVHREREIYGKAALIESLATSAAEFYGIPPDGLEEYATQRAEAMLLRDERVKSPEKVRESDWQEIEKKLNAAYSSLAAAVREK